MTRKFIPLSYRIKDFRAELDQNRWWRSVMSRDAEIEQIAQEIEFDVRRGVRTIQPNRMGLLLLWYLLELRFYIRITWNLIAGRQTMLDCEPDPSEWKEITKY